mgnify:CR=1 FL=1
MKKKNPAIFWEIASHDAERTAEFLKKVFGWKIIYDKDSTIHYIPTESAFSKYDGGVFTLRKAKLPFLTIYIQVDDINKKVQEIEDNGGYIVEQVNEVAPGTLICLFNEPSGVTLGMLQRIGKIKS